MYAGIYTTNQPANSKSFDEPAQDSSPDKATTSTSAERVARAVASRARLIAERDARASAAEACRAHWLAKQQARASALANGNSPPTSDSSEAETRAIPDVETARARVIAHLVSLTTSKTDEAGTPTTTSDDGEPDQSKFLAHYYADDLSSYDLGNNEPEKTAHVLMSQKFPGLDDRNGLIPSSENAARINEPEIEAPLVDAETVPHDLVRVDDAARAPRLIEWNGVMMTAAEQFHAEMRAEIETRIQKEADRNMPPLAKMINTATIKPRWQLFDNRSKIAEYNANKVAEDDRYCEGPRKGQFKTSNESILKLKLEFKLEPTGKWHSRYVNFQDPYDFRGKVSIFPIHQDYHDTMYERARQDAKTANKLCRATNRPIEMIGHVQRSHAEHRTLRKKKGEAQRGGSPSLPYNFAHLVWKDGMPFVAFYNGYRGHLLPLVRKAGRSADSAQFELYGIE